MLSTAAFVFKVTMSSDARITQMSDSLEIFLQNFGERSQREVRRRHPRQSSQKWPPGGWSNNDHPGLCANASRNLCAAAVQQPE